MSKWLLSTKHRTEAGFTITELMIATAIFSVVLLLCTFGIIQIGNTFYKGSNVSRTQQSARSVIDTLSQAIQFGGDDLRADGQVGTELVPASQSSGALCVGNTRYRFAKNQITSATNVGVRVDKFSGARCNSSGSSDPGSVPKELLASGMRLLQLSITEQEGNYTITLEVGTGDDAQLASGKCQGGSGDQFCATSVLQTTVQRRIL